MRVVTRSVLSMLSLGLQLSGAIAFHMPAYKGNAYTTTASTNKVGNLITSKLSVDTTDKVGFKSLPVQLLLATLLMNGPVAPINAYDTSDYASETVVEAVSQLRESSGDSDKTFAVFEDIAKIITEGKGIGGNVNYAGVTLERGEVADEDTSIYNPGLTLLTESEKERLVDAIVQNKAKGLATKTWKDNNQYAYEFLKTNLDPFHTYELRPYLSIFPFYAAGVYIVTLLVQQTLRPLFEAAYILGALLVFAPAIFLVLTGP